VKNDTFDLVFAGNIGPAQSVERIVEAANLLKDQKDVVFHIVGDGLSRSACEQMAKDYALDNVIFYGYHDVSEMPEYYKLADAFLITMVDNEVVNSTLPAKVQSYMMAGKPIVGAINGEVKDVIKEADCGLCCDSLDHKTLAELILQMKDDEAKCEEYAHNAFKYYEEHFEKETCINDLIDTLSGLIS
jgi:glycosyltransferase involved in cell wall biosynthesis